MRNILLGEQILSLRKKNGITQEQLAKKMGVSNQAVSKWESGQCLPDTQLIPEIAEFFQISIDDLFGYKNDMNDGGYRLCFQIENVNSITDKEYSNLLACIKVAHAIAWKAGVKEDAAFANLTLDDVVEHMIDGEWGTSLVVMPQIMTAMRTNCIFFSDGRKVYLGGEDEKNLCEVLAVFSDRWLLEIILSIYNITCQDIEDYATYDQIASETMISKEKIISMIEDILIKYLYCRKEKEGFRIKDEYMCVVPILSLLIPIL